MHSVDGICRGGVAGAKCAAEFVSDEADHPASGHVVGEFLAGVVIFIHPVIGPFAAKLLHERCSADGIATGEHFAEVREDGFAPFGDIAAQCGKERTGRAIGKGDEEIAAVGWDFDLGGADPLAQVGIGELGKGNALAAAANGGNQK